jgi:phosphate-selective porin OprO/OprP
VKRIRRGSAFSTVFLLWLASPVTLAQSPESYVPPDATQLIRDAGQYAMPEVATPYLEKVRVEDEHDRFSLKIGLSVLLDYTSFDQDADSYAQVGNQSDEFEVRSMRLMARGHFELFRRWDYQLSYEYKGFANEPGEPDWSGTDVSIKTDIGNVGTLKIGKMKEAHVYEMVGDAANLPQSERFLSPFFTSRNIGVQMSNTMLGERGTWTVGVFNDWLKSGESLSSSGTDVVARVTVLPVWRDDGARFLHVGASVRYYGGDDDELRFRGQPASHVADYYVDSGVVAGDHAVNFGVEGLASVDQYSLLAEYVTSRVSTQDAPDATLDGWYLTASWVVTGDRRPYDRAAGYARRVMPQGRWGAVELIARYGLVDLDDGPIAGGTMDGFWLGVNWWGNQRFKAGLAWGDVDLDRFDRTGNTKTLLSRLQWIF